EHPHMRCWRKSQIPERLHYGTNPRIPDLTCLADVHWRISTSDYLARREHRMPLGQHGYDNDNPLMRAVFLARGPAFRKGVRIDGFPSVDLYPLMTHLLDFPALPGDGNMGPWHDALRAPAATGEILP